MWPLISKYTIDLLESTGTSLKRALCSMPYPKTMTTSINELRIKLLSQVGTTENENLKSSHYFYTTLLSTCYKNTFNLFTLKETLYDYKRYISQSLSFRCYLVYKILSFRCEVIKKSYYILILKKSFSQTLYI
jgi:hypothetical protein